MSATNVLRIFETIDTEEKAYWLGFLYADGSVSSTDNRIELGLAEKDLRHIEKFRDFIGIQNKISYRASTKSYRYAFRSISCKADLIKQGCVPKKSLILNFPTEYQVPKNFVKDFIRGYFDGDGWFTNTENCFQAGIIGTEDFIKGFLNTVELENKNNKKIFTVHREDGVNRDMCGGYGDDLNCLNRIYKDATIYNERKYRR